MKKEKLLKHHVPSFTPTILKSSRNIEIEQDVFSRLYSPKILSRVSTPLTKGTRTPTAEIRIHNQTPPPISNIDLFSLLDN